MVEADEFTNYCIQALEVNFGQLSNGILNKISSKKQLSNKSTINDFNEFIDLIEQNISILSGKTRANEIYSDLRTKAMEINEKPKPVISISSDIDKEINSFLAENTLPTDSDISDYAKYITLKYGGKTKKIEKEIIEKVRIHVKEIISLKTIHEEICKFLTRYPQPTQNDISDFINYIRFLKLNFQEDALREHIEKERLFRKFHESHDVPETTELDQFVDFIKNHSDKKEISKIMKKQELSYLIKDDAGNSDQLLSELSKLATPSEKDMKDTLEGLGLKHMINKK